MIVETPDGFRWKFEDGKAPEQNWQGWAMYGARRWVKSRKDWTKELASSGRYESFKIIEE